MALKQAKKQVNLKASVADNIGIPKFPDTNIAAQIAKPISEAIDVFRKKAEADASANWQFQFNQQSRDHYLQLKDKFKFDPDGMRNAIDSYSQTTLANTPGVFKNVAQNILAQKNLANMSYATSNFNAREDQKALDAWNLTKDQTMVDAGSHLETINMNPDLSVLDINSFIGNDLQKTMNHNYGGAENVLVNTNRYSGSQLKKDLDNDIIDLEALRVFNIIKKSGDVEGNKYFLNYAAGQDSFPVTPDNVDNPIFQKYAKDITDPFKRSQIITKVKSLYDDYNSKNINGLKSAKTKYPLDRLQDAGSILDVNNFANGANGNATNFVINAMPGISDTDFPRAVEIVNKNINVQKLVSKALDYEVIDNFEDNEQMELFKTALFRRQGINDENITNVENRNALGTAMEILKNQNMEPTAVLKKINKDYNVNFKTPGMIDDFKENLSLFNYIKSKDMFPYITIENEHIYNAANKIGVMAKESDEVIAEKLNNLMTNKGNLEENYNKILKVLRKIDKRESYRKQIRNPKMSDKEIIALNLTAEYLSIDSEHHLFRLLTTTSLFKKIERSVYNRRKRALLPYIEQLRISLSEKFNQYETYFIVDSMPLEVCKLSRSNRSKICKEDFHSAPDKGFCASQQMYFYGYKIHASCSVNGVIKNLDISNASTHDVHYLNDIKQQLANCVLLGDKGYLSEEHQLDLFETAKIKLEVPMRSNQKNYKKQPYIFRKSRKRIETLFSQLCDQFMIRRNYAKTFLGFKTRILSKITALTVVQYINQFVFERNLNNLKTNII